MTRTMISPKESEEVKRLLSIYQDATLKAAQALSRYSTDRLAPELARQENLRAGEAYRRIREIHHDEAVPIRGATKPFEVK